MLRRGILVVILVLFIVGCGDNNASDKTKEKESESISNQEIQSNDIKNIKIPNEFVLSDEALVEIKDWKKYKELEIQIKFLKEGDLSFFNDELDIVNTFMKEFETSIPDRLLENPISSRVIVLKTLMLRLNENLRLDNISKSEKLNAIKAVFIAYSNFNFQINKKLENDRYNKIQSEF